MKNLRNKNAPPPEQAVQSHLSTAWDKVLAVYNKLGDIEALADAIGAGQLDDFLTATDIDTLAELNAILTDATLLNFDEVATAAQGAKVDFITITQPVDLDQMETRLNELDAVTILKGSWDASSGTFPGAGVAQAGWSYIISVPGTVDGVDFNVNDRIIAILDNASEVTYANNWVKMDYTDQVISVAGLVGVIAAADLRTALNVEDGATADQTGAEIKTALFAEADTNNLTDALLGKLSGIEAGAQVNVALASQAEAEAGVEATKTMTPLRVAQAIAALGGGTGGLAALVKSANYTAAAGDFVFGNSSGGSWTLTLPLTPQADDLVVIKDLVGSVGQNPITVDGNGETINLNNNLYLDTPFATVWLIYDGTEWKATVDGMMLQGPTEHMTFALSDETTPLTTGLAKLTTRTPYMFFLSSVKAHVTTAPTGAAIEVDINEDGVSVLTNPLTIDAGEKTSATSVVTDPMGITIIILGSDTELTFDIDQVGSTVAGTGLKVTLTGYRVQL
jgi:hypothetical protein